MSVIEITLEGERPMLHHNIRLANPLDPYTQKLRTLTAKRKKTDEDLSEIMWWEARGGIYETPEGFVGLPSDNLWRALYDAATAFRRGADIKRALIPVTDVEPIIFPEGKHDVDDFLNAGNIDLRMVQVSRRRVPRSRPLIPVPWSVTHRFDLLSDIVDARDLTDIIDRAGRVVGIGDFRPRFGTFTGKATEL